MCSYMRTRRTNSQPVPFREGESVGTRSSMHRQESCKSTWLPTSTPSQTLEYIIPAQMVTKKGLKVLKCELQRERHPR